MRLSGYWPSPALPPEVVTTCRCCVTTRVLLLKRLNLDLPTYYDANAATVTALSDLINFEGYPTTLLLDHQGIILAAPGRRRSRV